MKRILMAAALTLTLAATPVLAAPTARLDGGDTSVAFSQGFVDALESLNAGVTPVKPGALKRGVAVFRIPGGALDATTLRGDVFHTGGLNVSAGGTTVTLLNFIIETTADPVLTGLVSIDGEVVDRIPLFKLDADLMSNTEISRSGRVVIRDVILKLTPEGAGALNFAFGLVNFFVEDFEIGVAEVVTRIKSTEGG